MSLVASTSSVITMQSKQLVYDAEVSRAASSSNSLFALGFTSVAVLPEDTSQG